MARRTSAPIVRTSNLSRATGRALRVTLAAALLLGCGSRERTPLAQHGLSRLAYQRLVAVSRAATERPAPDDEAGDDAPEPAPLGRTAGPPGAWLEAPPAQDVTPLPTAPAPAPPAVDEAPEVAAPAPAPVVQPVVLEQPAPPPQVIYVVQGGYPEYGEATETYVPVLVPVGVVLPVAVLPSPPAPTVRVVIAAPGGPARPASADPRTPALAHPRVGAAPAGHAAAAPVRAGRR
jgi:hypothetical protein